MIVAAQKAFVPTCEVGYITGQDVKIDGFQYNM